MNGNKNVHVIYIYIYIFFFVLNRIFPMEVSALQGGQAQPNSTTSWTFPSEPISSSLLSPDLFLWNTSAAPRIAAAPYLWNASLEGKVTSSFSFFFFFYWSFRHLMPALRNCSTLLRIKVRLRFASPTLFFPPTRFCSWQFQWGWNVTCLAGMLQSAC